MTVDGHRTVEAMTEEECRDLLAGAYIGRLAYVRCGRPEIVPLNYVLAQGGVVVRVGPSATLDVLRSGDPVAFEIDRIDPDYHTGWSVVVHALPHEVTEEPDLEQVERLPLRPWAPGARDHWVRLVPERMTGRRLG